MQLVRLLVRVRAMDAVGAASRGAASSSQSAWLGWRALSTAAWRPSSDERGSSRGPSQDLAAALLSQGLSHSTIIAIVNWQPSPSRTAQYSIVKKVGWLQHVFGSDHADRMLSVEPSLLSLTSQRIGHHLQSLEDVLDLSPKQALQMARNHPTILRASPELLRNRHKSVQELLQMDDAVMRTFVMRIPGVLRLAEGRLGRQISWLQEAGGVSRGHVVKTLKSWPQLATTSNEALTGRHGTLRQLFDATDEDMRRICRSYPNLLARDGGSLEANMRRIQSLVGVGDGEVRALVRREPGLLSFNMSTLAVRWSYLMQVLRLPREMGVALLTAHRPLLGTSVITNLPARVEALRSLARVPSDDQLYPLLHKHVGIVRYPVELMETKLAAIRTIAALHPDWEAAWEERAPTQVLRSIMVSWGCIYRLAFLVATGQASTIGLFAAIRAAHPAFARSYPDYASWLDRYNEFAGPDWAVPSTGSLRPTGGSARPAPAPGADCQHASLDPWGASHTRSPAEGGDGELGSEDGDFKAKEDDGPFPLHDQQQPQRRQQQCEWVRGEGPLLSGEAHEGPVVEASQPGILASWLGISKSDAERLLSSCPELAAMSWSAWESRVEALEALLYQLGHLKHDGASTEETGLHALPQDNGSSSSSSSSSGDGSSNGNGANSSGSDSESDCSDGDSGCAGGSIQEIFQRGATATGPLRPSARLTSCATVADKARQLLSAPDVHPSVAMALRAAANVADFSPLLWRPRWRAAPPEVGEALLACPEQWARHVFVARCRWLAALAAASPEVAGELRSATVTGVSRALAAPRCAYAALQYLVVTGAPPGEWALPARALLSKGQKWTLPSSFHRAHPGFGEWLQGMRGGGRPGRGATGAPWGDIDGGSQGIDALAAADSAALRGA